MMIPGITSADEGEGCSLFGALKNEERNLAI
jgi:hypothetical protein